MWNKPKANANVGSFISLMVIYLFNDQLWEKVATIVQQGNTIPVAALLFIVWFVPTCGVKRYWHSTWMLYEKSNEIKR